MIEVKILIACYGRLYVTDNRQSKGTCVLFMTSSVHLHFTFVKQKIKIDEVRCLCVLKLVYMYVSAIIGASNFHLLHSCEGTH